MAGFLSPPKRKDGDDVNVFQSNKCRYNSIFILPESTDARRMLYGISGLAFRKNEIYRTVDFCKSTNPLPPFNIFLKVLQYL